MRINLLRNKKGIEENPFIIIIIMFILLVMVIFVGIIIQAKDKEKLCEQNEFASHYKINGKEYCFKYENNKLIAQEVKFKCKLFECINLTLIT